jgi:hypothetical protein
MTGVVRQRFVFGIEQPSNLLLEDDQVTGRVGSVVGGRIQHLGATKFLHAKATKSLKLGGFGLNFNYDTVSVVNPPLYPTYDDKDNPTTATVSELRLTLTRAQRICSTTRSTRRCSRAE